MNAYDQLSPENRKNVDALLAETKSNGGLAPLDVEAFWKDQAAALADPFGAHIPQVPLGAICNWECVFDELGIEQDWRRFLYEDRAWALDVSRQYNDLAERVVGRRLLRETPDVPTERQWPPVKELYDIFEAENIWVGGKAGSWWLKPSSNTTKELSDLLDRVEQRLENLSAFMLPDHWEAATDGRGPRPPVPFGDSGQAFLRHQPIVPS